MRLIHIGVSRISYFTLGRHLRFHGVKFTGKFGHTYTYSNVISAQDTFKYHNLTPATLRKTEMIRVFHLQQNVLVNLA